MQSRDCLNRIVIDDILVHQNLLMLRSSILQNSSEFLVSLYKIKSDRHYFNDSSVNLLALTLDLILFFFGH